MIDNLMTELCKSFNPFIKLDGWVGGGGWRSGVSSPLVALYPRTLAHLASVKDPQTLQALMTHSVERIYSTFGHRTSSLGGVDAL